MGIIDKVMFWKHDDDLDFDKIADKEMDGSFDTPDPTTDLNSQQKDGLGLNEKSMFNDTADPLAQPATTLQQPMTQTPMAPSVQPTNNGDISQHLALINSKLDTVKVILNNLDQRMANLEKNSGVEKKERLW